MFIKYSITILFLLVLIIQPDYPQEPQDLYFNYSNIKTFSPYIGLHEFSPQKGLANHQALGSLEYGLRYGFFFDHNQQMEARLGYIQTETVPGGASQHLFTMGLDLMWYTFDGVPFGKPYLLTEAGTMWNLNSNEVHVGIDIGAGIIFNLFDWVPLRLEVRETFFLREGNDTTISIGPHFVFDDRQPDSDRDGVPDYKDKEKNSPLGARVDRHGRVQSVSLKVNFESGKSTIRRQYKNQIKEVGAYLQSSPRTTIEIEGHTDSQGPKSYNQRLSERRALAVKNELVKKYRISKDRISTSGFGEDNPVASNTTASGRAMNRRIDVNFKR